MLLQFASPMLKLLSLLPNTMPIVIEKIYTGVTGKVDVVVAPGKELTHSYWRALLPPWF